MSDLQEIGAQVNSVAKGMAIQAQSLFAISARLKQLASSTAAAARHAEDGREAVHAATAMSYAAEHCLRAAQLLQAGQSAANAFVANVAGGGMAAKVGDSRSQAFGHFSGDYASQLSHADHALAGAAAALQRWDENDQRVFVEWFGTTDETARNLIAQRVERSRAMLSSLRFLDAGPGAKPSLYAQVVDIDDPEHHVLIGPQFVTAGASGTDSKAGVIIHEVSHFNDVGATIDYEDDYGEKTYGVVHCRRLAESFPEAALMNADNFEYFVENYQ